MIPLFTKNLRAHQAKRLLAAVVLFSVFVTCLIGGELSPSAALVAQITNQWSKVPAQALRHAAEAGDAQAQYYLYLSEL